MADREYDSFYDNVFDDEEIEMLDDLSGEEYDDKAQNRSIQGLVADASRLIPEIQDLEKTHRRELELIAEIIVTDYYKLKNLYDVKFDLRIVDELPSPETQPPKNAEESKPPEIEDTKLEEIKRRLINSITQGGSVRGTFLFALFKEHLDDINPKLFENYKKLMDSIFSTYDTDNGVAFFLAVTGGIENYINKQYKGVVGENVTPGGIGYSYVSYDEESETWTIVARGKTFSILLHEAIKGIYELISQVGFTDDAKVNQQVQQTVDVPQNEIEDLRYGKHIYDSLVDVLMDIHKDDRIEFTTIRELFFVEIYALPAQEFISFIKNAVNVNLTKRQQRWAEETIDRLVTEIRNYESGLSGLGTYNDPGIDDDEEDDDEYGMFAESKRLTKFKKVVKEYFSPYDTPDIEDCIFDALGESEFQEKAYDELYRIVEYGIERDNLLEYRGNTCADTVIKYLIDLWKEDRLYGRTLMYFVKPEYLKGQMPENERQVAINQKPEPFNPEGYDEFNL